VQPKILDIFLLKKVYIVYMDWWAGFSSWGDMMGRRLIGWYCVNSLGGFYDFKMRII
jgi:hypothetical protein